MRLQPPQIRTLLGAIEAHFDPFSIERLLEARFGLKLHNITAVLKNFSHQAVDIHRYFDQRNKTEELLAALRDARPNVSEFVVLVDSAGFTQLPPAGSLEALVRKGGRAYHDVLAFRSQLSSLEAAVCRVETPTGFGTGFLIRPNMVLTNYHVVEDCVCDKETLIHRITCLFDYKQGLGDYSTPALRCYVSRIIAKSPYAAEDSSTVAENTDATKLDYAILVLTQKLANEPVVDGGSARGFIPVPVSPRTLSRYDGLLMLQHPRARPMKVDIGSVTWTGKTRMRHSINTESGSSGSPILDANLDLVGLHHAGFDWPGAECPFNQAIPIALIVADARRQGISIQEAEHGTP